MEKISPKGNAYVKKTTKVLSGKIVVTMEWEFDDCEIDCTDELYTDKYGNEYYEENYEIDVNEIIDGYWDSVGRVLDRAEDEGWKIIEKSIE